MGKLTRIGPERRPPASRSPFRSPATPTATPRRCVGGGESGKAERPVQCHGVFYLCRQHGGRRRCGRHRSGWLLKRRTEARRADAQGTEECVAKGRTWSNIATAAGAGAAGRPARARARRSLSSDSEQGKVWQGRGGCSSGSGSDGGGIGTSCWSSRSDVASKVNMPP